jgi:hypothetical protein
MQLASIDGDELNTGDMQKAYITGNKMVNASGGIVVSPTSDNWSKCISKFNSVAQVRSATALFPISVTPLSADEAYADVLANVGATKPKQDAIDTRIVKEVRNGSSTYTGSKDGLRGIIDSQGDVGGYPTMAGGTAPADADHDGMPDSWETAHGLDPNNADDRNNTNLSPDNYANLEMYLNELAGDPVRYGSSQVKTASGFAAQPSIKTAAGKMTLSLKFAARINVSRIDLSGKTIEVLHDGAVPAGDVSIALHQKNKKAVGVTFIKVKGGGIDFIRREIASR